MIECLASAPDLICSCREKVQAVKIAPCKTVIYEKDLQLKDLKVTNEALQPNT